MFCSFVVVWKIVEMKKLPLHESPFPEDSTASRLLNKVKPCSAGLLLGWVTIFESPCSSYFLFATPPEVIAVTVEFLVMYKVAFRFFDSFSMLLLPFFWPLHHEDNVNAQLHEWLYYEYLLPGTEFFCPLCLCRICVELPFV